MPHAETHRCPRCDSADVALSLLTSMTRYFACRLCAWRWNTAVTRDEAPA